MESIKEFLDKNDFYVKVDYPVLNKSIDISEDDEIYFFQCAKDFDIMSLKNTRIKMPGKTTLNSSELITEKCTPNTTTVAISDKRGDIKLKSINVQGKIVFRKRIEIKRNEDLSVGKSKFRITVPNDIKERHPLHGACYKEKINLKRQIKNRLEQSEKFRNVAQPYITSAVKKKRHKHALNENSINSGEDMLKEIKIENDDSLSWLRNI